MLFKMHKNKFLSTHCMLLGLGYVAWQWGERPKQLSIRPSQQPLPSHAFQAWNIIITWQRPHKQPPAAMACFSSWLKHMT